MCGPEAVFSMFARPDEFFHHITIKAQKNTAQVAVFLFILVAYVDWHKRQR